MIATIPEPPKFSRCAIISISLILLFPLEIYTNTQLPTRSHLWLTGISTTFTFSTPFLAIICGLLGRREDRLSGHTRGGTGIAATGIILGSLILVLSTYAFYGIIRADLSVSQSVARGKMMAVGSGLFCYQKAHPDIGFPYSLDELFQDSSVADVMKKDRRFQWPVDVPGQIPYKFAYSPNRSRSDGPRDSFQLVADPNSSFFGNRAHFYLNQSRILRSSLTHAANSDSPERFAIP